METDFLSRIRLLTNWDREWSHVITQANNAFFVTVVLLFQVSSIIKSSKQNVKYIVVTTNNNSDKGEKCVFN